MINKEIFAIGKCISALKSGRSKLFETKTIEKADVEKYNENGWEVVKRLKSKMQIKKLKSHKVCFQNKVWSLFANLGFDGINKQSPIEIVLKEKKMSFEIFSFDDDVAICINCLVSKFANDKSNFKEIIEDIGFSKQDLISEIRKSFGKKIKVVNILATSGYRLSDDDKERLEKFCILHFDENTIDYFSQLNKYMGASAKYQLLGYILADKTIPNLNMTVPAIRGEMGGHKYYSFSIEPEKLLKLGYVLHRNSGNKNDMPAYQRLIKKARLKSVSAFVNNGGFFPNSIIVNISSDGDLKFDLSDKQDKYSISRIGLLHLPQKYKSIYIIDGQHRLYGYAESEYKDSNTVPVVAFVNLVKSDQIKLFMEINQNQKAVSKNLRTTLEADLLWFSEDKKEQREALSARIAQELGENPKSPLFERVIIGENNKTHKCCITLDMIKRAINKSGYVDRYSGKGVCFSKGSFDTGVLDDFHDKLYAFIELGLSYVKNKISTEWEKGELGYVCYNVGINSLIKIFADLVECFVANNCCNLSQTSADIFNEIEPHLSIIVDFLKMIPIDKQMELKKSYGAGGETKYWRMLQNALFTKNNTFNPMGLQDYLKEETKEFNSDAIGMLSEIETDMNTQIKTILYNTYGEKWLYNVPEKIHTEMNSLATKKAFAEKREVDPWECLYFINYRDIITLSDNWKIFESIYGRDEDGKSKDKKTEWIKQLNDFRNVVSHGNKSISESNYNELKKIHTWYKENTSKSK